MRRDAASDAGHRSEITAGERDHMPVIIAGALLLLSAAGIAAALLRLKEKKTLRRLCVAVCAVTAALAAGFICLTLYFGWAVRNQEPKEPPDAPSAAYAEGTVQPDGD